MSSALGAGSSSTVAVPLDVEDQQQSPTVFTQTAEGDTGHRTDRDETSSGPARPEAQGSFESASTAGEPPATRAIARVMVVEDDPDLRLYLTRLLAGDGCEVLPFGDAEAAWASLQSGYCSAINLLLTDVLLPGRSGLELVVLVRDNSTTARVPIIMLTAFGGGGAADGLAAGADDYITKPFTSQELLARVRVSIELHRIRKQARVRRHPPEPVGDPRHHAVVGADHGPAAVRRAGRHHP